MNPAEWTAFHYPNDYGNIGPSPLLWKEWKSLGWNERVEISENCFLVASKRGDMLIVVKKTK